MSFLLPPRLSDGGHNEDKREDKKRADVLGKAVTHQPFPPKIPYRGPMGDRVRFDAII